MVIDELQMISDENRGGNLEWVLTFLKLLDPTPQLLGLTAAVDELQGLDDWLETKVIRCNERPLPLTELVVFPGGKASGISVMRGARETVEDRIQGWAANPSDFVVNMLSQSPDESILVFRPTVPEAEETASSIRAGVRFLGPAQESINELRGIEPTTLNARLCWCLEQSVAFHNSELTAHERRIIEEGFRKGTIKCVVATPGLAMGVNLPCAKVVIVGLERPWVTGPGKHYRVSEYKNMSGRAGRLGVITAGNGISYILAPDEATAQRYLRHYVNGQLEPIRSTFESGRLDNLVLHALSQVGKGSMEAIMKLVLSTFAARSWNTPVQKQAVRVTISEAIRRFVNAGLAWEEEEAYAISELGQICAQRGVEIDSFCTIVDWIRNNGYFNDAAFLALLSQTAEMAKCRFPGGKRVAVSTYQAASGILEQHNSPPRPEISQLLDDLKMYYYEGGLRTRAGRMLATVLMYMSGAGIKEIERTLCVKYGTLKTIAETYKWLTDCAYSVAQCLGQNQQYLGAIAELVLSLEHGVPSTAHNLAQCGIGGRAFLMKLVEAGLTAPLELLEAPTEQLAQLLYGGAEERVGKLKEEVVSALGPLIDVYSAQVRSVSPETKSIIHRIYCSRGLLLERPIHDLLTRFLPSLGVRRISCQAAGEADYHFNTRDGRSGVIALASRRAPNRKVNMNKAGQVLQQSPELHPTVFVCLGFPGFDTTAISKAAAHAENLNFKIIAIPALLDAIALVEQRRLSVESLYTAIEDRRGHLTSESFGAHVSA